MIILNEDYFKSMKNFREENGLQDELTDNDCKCYANMLSVYADITHQKYSFDEMLKTYDYITDVIDGKRPDIMIIKDHFRDIFRLLKGYSITEDLDDETTKKIAFLIYQAKCVFVMDSETQQPTWNMEMFNEGTKAFLDEYEYELKEFPSKFTIENYSGDSRDDYGYSIENPISVTSVALQYDYLNSIETDDGKPIIYDRTGSYSGKNDIFVDEYNVYVKSFIGKKKIATLYLTGDGSTNSTKAPKGFRFIK